MTDSDIGKRFSTAIKNIKSDRSLTPEERLKAEKISQLIDPTDNKCNWFPIFVREIGNRSYQLIGSSLMLEATKMAGAKIIYCIQIDNEPETEQQILKIEDILSKDIILINSEDEKSLKTKLEEVKHIGNRTAKKILEQRPFTSESDLKGRTPLQDKQLISLTEKYHLDFSTDNHQNEILTDSHKTP